MLKQTFVPIIVCILLFQAPGFSSTQTQSSATPKLTLEDSTPLKIRISRNVSSADAKIGEQVDFEVLEEVKVSDLTVIPKGGIAWGTVTNAQPKRRIGRGGKLDMTIDTVRLASGEKAALRAVKELSGGGHTGAMTAGIVVTGLIVWPAAPFFLFMHGKDITIPKGTEITAYINGNFNIDRSKFEQAANPPAAAPLSQQVISSMATSVTISSSPEGAEVEVDGSFIGNTPLSLNLNPGEHSIVAKKKGFKVWERKLKTTGGASKVNAELDAEVSAVPPAKP